MQRISIIGNAGAGKTTLARELARRLALAHIELDGIFHQRGWVPLPREQFQQRVRERVAGERWVADGNYNSLGIAEIIWERADTIVWLDLSRPVATLQALRRTLRRGLTREPLWNGNRERLRNLFAKKPEDNIVLWAWTHHERVRARYARMMHDGTWSGRTVHRLGTRAEIKAFLAGI